MSAPWNTEWELCHPAPSKTNTPQPPAGLLAQTKSTYSVPQEERHQAFLRLCHSPVTGALDHVAIHHQPQEDAQSLTAPFPQALEGGTC